ncbi:hypothetical protein LX36DRAFT_151644 [Colletotrichum falcatum]|nr:hypothetical protein LX36DRAFT_151644 [Colletotrichum falcatum]
MLSGPHYQDLLLPCMYTLPCIYTLVRGASTPRSKGEANGWQLRGCLRGDRTRRFSSRLARNSRQNALFHACMMIAQILFDHLRSPTGSNNRFLSAEREVLAAVSSPNRSRASVDPFKLRYQLHQRLLHPLGRKSHSPTTKTRTTGVCRARTRHTVTRL